jgi:hypothetical protein
MLDTYIKNRGATKTIIHNNNHNKVNEINWDADYDGNIANISVDLNSDGKINHYNVKLDNYDLAKILNIDSVRLPIDQRLKSDFKQVKFIRQPSIYIDDLNTSDLMSTPYEEIFKSPMSFTEDELLKTSKPNYTHISSPLPNEELLIPLTIDKDLTKSYVLTPRKHHKRPKTHKTHRVYKHHRATTSRNSKARGKNKTKSKTYKKSTNKSTNKNSLQTYFNI